MGHVYPEGAFPGDPAEVREKVRELLLTLPPEKRPGVLCEMDICEHCGVDERSGAGRLPRRCQCWNDE